MDRSSVAELLSGSCPHAISIRTNEIPVYQMRVADLPDPTNRKTRPAPRWSDLGNAPMHDFPVRDEILYQYLPMTPEMNILEIGPGSGFTAFCLSPRVRQLTLMDVAEEPIQDLKRKLEPLGNVRFAQGDAGAANFRSPEGHKFDLVFGLDVFEYVKDARTCLANLASVLRPGGQLFLTYPNSGTGVGDGVNYFARGEDIEELLSFAGFRCWRVFAVRPTRYSAFVYKVMHEWPLHLYRKLRRANVESLPQTYEATWAFRFGRKLERYKVLLHGYWAILAAILRLGGDFFVAEPVSSNDIVGKQLVIEAWR